VAVVSSSCASLTWSVAPLGALIPCLQAMVTDLLHHSPSTVFEFSYPDKKGRKDFSVLLDEADPVWRTLR